MVALEGLNQCVDDYTTFDAGHVEQTLKAGKFMKAASNMALYQVFAMWIYMCMLIFLFCASISVTFNLGLNLSRGGLGNIPPAHERPMYPAKTDEKKAVDPEAEFVKNKQN